MTESNPLPPVRYRLRIRASFEAAHHLRSYRGAPEPNHGHSWTVEVELTSAGLGEEGMAVDFVEVRQALDDLVRPLDHNDLNTIPPFDQRSPTTEHLAAWFLGRMRERLPHAGISAVTVWEGPHCSATCEVLETSQR